MTRKDVMLAAVLSAVALGLYVGIKQVLGGHWDWVTFIIWLLGALLFGFGAVYAKTFLTRMVDEMTAEGVSPDQKQNHRGTAEGVEHKPDTDSSDGKDTGKQAG